MMICTMESVLTARQPAPPRNGQVKAKVWVSKEAARDALARRVRGLAKRIQEAIGG
jgi:hypothetical protein